MQCFLGVGVGGRLAVGSAFLRVAACSSVRRCCAAPLTNLPPAPPSRVPIPQPAGGARV